MNGLGELLRKKVVHDLGEVTLSLIGVVLALFVVGGAGLFFFGLFELIRL